MKKQILYEALDQLINDDELRIVRLLTNKENPSEAMIERYNKVIEEMHQNAYNKAFPN